MNACVKQIIHSIICDDVLVLMIEKETDEIKPIVFVFHRLLLNAKCELPLAYCLADQGYFCVLIDMLGHGQRIESFDKTGRYEFNNLYKDVYDTAKDTLKITNYLRNNDKYNLNFNSISSVGISIGASVALVSAYINKDIRNVVSIIGNPCCWEYTVVTNSFKMFASSKTLSTEKIRSDIIQYDPINQLCKVNPLPNVYFQNGKLDIIIPIKSVNESFEELRKIYKNENQEERLSQTKYSKAGHEISINMINDLLIWLNEKSMGMRG